MIDYMKEAKILYLADVLEDIAKEMERDFHNRPFCKSINDIVKELRDTLAFTTPTNPANMREERIQIKRIEKRYMMSPVPGIPDSEMPRYEDMSRRGTISELLDYIRRMMNNPDDKPTSLSALQELAKSLWDIEGHQRHLAALEKMLEEE